MNDLAGKTVVITGASRGIGAATARHLAEMGANVVLAARSGGAISALAAEIRDAGGTAYAFTCDVAEAGSVEDLIGEAMIRTGRLDVLVNNAGVIEPIAHLADSDPSAWSEVVDINFKGVYYGIRFALPRMLAAGGGTVINISSGAANRALEGWSHYCATKAGVLMLTEATDLEYRDKGVRVIGLSPGTVATEMQVQIKASGVNPVSQLDPSVHIPTEWVAEAIAYLCGPGGDDYLGRDFSLKTEEGRAALGLPSVDPG